MSKILSNLKDGRVIVTGNLVWLPKGPQVNADDDYALGIVFEKETQIRDRREEKDSVPDYLKVEAKGTVVWKDYYQLHVQLQEKPARKLVFGFWIDEPNPLLKKLNELKGREVVVSGSPRWQPKSTVDFGFTQFKVKPADDPGIQKVPDQPNQASNGLSAKIVIKSKLPLVVVPGEMDGLQAELVLTNEGQKPLRLAMLCSYSIGSWKGGCSNLIRPDWWKSDAPPDDKLAEKIVALQPGKTVSFPIGAAGVRGVDGKFKLTAGYEIGAKFAKQHDTWTGELKAEVVIPVEEKKRHVSEDEKQLQGTWRVLSLELDGVRYGEGTPKIKDAKVIISENKLTEVDKDRVNPMLFKLDPTAKPRIIQFKPSSQANIHGIYALDGDTLRLCIVRDEDAKTPTDFTANFGSNRWLYVFKRDNP
jgi:uncharacterized protein (TIGR03067 family)